MKYRDTATATSHTGLERKGVTEVRTKFDRKGAVINV